MSNKDIGLEIEPRSPLGSYTPATAAVAVDAGLDPRILTHLAIEETQIDALLVERRVFGEMKE